MAINKILEREKGQLYGESVLALDAVVNQVPDGSLVADTFYAKARKYNYKYDTNMCCLEFTQMVWKTTSFIGCAYNNTFGKMYVSCKYNPPGNIPGQFKANVFSPKG